jgi:dolichol-phosphate mannosyltransferase
VKIILALPAYNEAAALPALLASFTEEMQSAGLTGAVVVVDDGSTDGTRELLAKWTPTLQLAVVVHEKNQGLGPTIRDALVHASRLAAPEDVIVTMDGDNTHPPALIPAMARLIQSGADLVIASRYRGGAQVRGLSPLRHMMSYSARFLFTAVFPMAGVRDYTSGFRAYRPAILMRAAAAYGDGFVTERGFASMAEILLKVGRLKPRICEVPLVMNYGLKPGRSKMKIGNTVRSTLKLVVRLRLAGNRRLFHA